MYNYIHCPNFTERHRGQEKQNQAEENDIQEKYVNLTFHFNISNSPGYLNR